MEILEMRIKEGQQKDPKFKQKYDFDVDILFHPENPKFHEIYCESDEKKDEIW